jgi:hypothetical protein
MLEAELELSHFGPEDLKQAMPFWKLVDPDGRVISEGQLPPRDLTAGGLHKLGSIRVALDAAQSASKLVLSVGISKTDAINHWDLFVFPPPLDTTGDLAWTSDLDEAKKRLAQGQKVLWLPGSQSVSDDPARPLVAGFPPIFWNTAWTDWQAPHTLGILCDPRHPALDGFPTDSHSNWQWWDIQHGARPFILTKHHSLKPVVQLIDDWFTNRKLAYVFEAKVGNGRLLACSADLHLAAKDNKPAAALLRSLMRYVESDRFSPQIEMQPSDLDELLTRSPAKLPGK